MFLHSKSLPPGPTYLSYVESFTEPRLESLIHFVHRYGDLFRIPGPFKVFFVNHLETIADILQSRPFEFTKKNWGYQRLAKFMGQGLLVSEGESWKKRRHLLQPIFHRQLLTQSVPFIVDMTLSMLERWQTTYAPKRQTFNLTKEMLNLVLTISAKMIFSEDLGEKSADIIRWVTMAHRSTVKSFYLGRFFPTWNSLRFYYALNNTELFAHHLIQKRCESPQKYPDLLTLMLQAQSGNTQEGLDLQSIIDEIKTFLVTGHETTGYALGWIFWQLMQYPDVLEQVLDEIQSVLGERKATFEDLSRLQYLRRVVEETLRIYPPIWVFTRKSKYAFTVKEYTIPAHSNLIICPYTLHRHPLYWPNPEAFDPDRFLPENIAQRPKLAYLPFGAGPRVCIAGAFAMLKIPLIVATILQHVIIRNKTKRDLAPYPQFSLKQNKPFHVQVENR